MRFPITRFQQSVGLTYLQPRDCRFWCAFVGSISISFIKVCVAAPLAEQLAFISLAQLQRDWNRHGPVKPHMR